MNKSHLGSMTLNRSLFLILVMLGTSYAQQTPDSTDQPADSPLHTPWGRRDPMPFIETMLCHPVPGVRYAFSPDELRDSAESDDAVIIGPLMPFDHKGFERSIVGYAYRPIQVHESNKISDLSRDRLVDILNGRVTNWKQLGQTDAPIHVYLHGSPVQKRTFAAEAAAMGVELANIKPVFVEGYEALADRAARDPAALVIGLRTIEIKGLTTIRVNGKAVDGIKDAYRYPLKTSIYLNNADQAEIAHVANALIDSPNLPANPATGPKPWAIGTSVCGVAFNALPRKYGIWWENRPIGKHAYLSYESDGEGKRSPEERFVHIEYFPVFINKDNAIENVSEDQISRILRGDIKDWKQLGRPESGEIQVYLHGGRLQQMALLSVLESRGMAVSTKVRGRAHLLNSYEDLGRAAGNDVNALVIGLNNLDEKNLKCAKIDGACIYRVARLYEYPLRRPVFVYRHKGASTEGAEKALRDAMDAAMSKVVGGN